MYNFTIWKLFVRPILKLAKIWSLKLTDRPWYSTWQLRGKYILLKIAIWTSQTAKISAHEKKYNSWLNEQIKILPFLIRCLRSCRRRRYGESAKFSLMSFFFFPSKKARLSLILNVLAHSRCLSDIKKCKKLLIRKMLLKILSIFWLGFRLSKVRLTIRAIDGCTVGKVVS